MNHQYLYSYRLNGDKSLHRIRAPEGMNDDAIRQALTAKHGRAIDFLLLERTAGYLDSHFDSLSEGAARSDTNSDDPHGWEQAIAKGNSGPRGGVARPSAEIAESWDRAFQKVSEGN